MCGCVHEYIKWYAPAAKHTPLSQGGYMTPDHISLAHSLLYSLLADIRREAVPLMDAFDINLELCTWSL